MIRINLLPAFEEFGAIPPQIYGAIALVLVGVLALGGWYWTLNGDIADAQGRLAALEARNLELAAVQAQLQEFEQEKQNTQQRIEAIEQLQRNQQGPVELMNVMIASMPSEPGLWLTSLSQQGNNITIEGKAFDVPFIADFIATLNDSPPFRFVELQYWEQESAETIRFRLNCETAEEIEDELP